MRKNKSLYKIQFTKVGHVGIFETYMVLAPDLGLAVIAAETQIHEDFGLETAFEVNSVEKIADRVLIVKDK
jgi:hypothetical protein